MVLQKITVSPFYNHAHFSHILIYITLFFLVIIHLSKKRHFFKVTITLLISTKYLQRFFYECDYNGEI
jgi:hypothetical protein